MKKILAAILAAVAFMAIGARDARGQQQAPAVRYTAADNSVFTQPRWSGPEGLALKTASELHLVGRFMLNEYLSGPRLVTVSEGAKFWCDAVSLQPLYVDGCVDADGKAHPNRVRLIDQPTAAAVPPPTPTTQTAPPGPPGPTGPPGRDGRDGRDATATATATATADAAPSYPQDGNFERYPSRRYPRGGGYDPSPPYYDDYGRITARDVFWGVVQVGSAYAGRPSIHNTNINNNRLRNTTVFPQVLPVKTDPGGGPNPFARRGFGGGGMARMGGRVGRR